MPTTYVYKLIGTKRANWCTQSIDKSREIFSLFFQLNGKLRELKLLSILVACSLLLDRSSALDHFMHRPMVRICNISIVFPSLSFLLGPLRTYFFVQNFKRRHYNYHQTTLNSCEEMCFYQKGLGKGSRVKAQETYKFSLLR